MVNELVAECGLERPEGRRRLNAAGQKAVEVTAERLAALVDQALGKEAGTSAPSEAAAHEPEGEQREATCSCGSGVPVTKVSIDGQTVELVALPLIFRQFRETGRGQDEEATRELFETVKIYNAVPAEAEGSYREAVAAGVCRLLRKGEASMSRTATYNTTVRWTGEHWGHLVMGNGPEMKFSAPPDAHGHAGVFTPEDAFVAAANTCVMMMFIWATERFKLKLLSYECRTEGTKLIELGPHGDFHAAAFPAGDPHCGGGRAKGDD